MQFILFLRSSIGLVFIIFLLFVTGLQGQVSCYKRYLEGAKLAIDTFNYNDAIAQYEAVKICPDIPSDLNIDSLINDTNQKQINQLQNLVSQKNQLIEDLTLKEKEAQDLAMEIYKNKVNYILDDLLAKRQYSKVASLVLYLNKEDILSQEYIIDSIFRKFPNDIVLLRTEISKFGNPKSGLKNVSISPDGQFVAYYHADRSLTILNTESGIIKEFQIITDFAFSNDGKVLSLLRSNRIETISLSDWSSTRLSLNEKYETLAYSPMDRYFILRKEFADGPKNSQPENNSWLTITNLKGQIQYNAINAEEGLDQRQSPILEITGFYNRDSSIILKLNSESNLEYNPKTLFKTYSDNLAVHIHNEKGKKISSFRPGYKFIRLSPSENLIIYGNEFSRRANILIAQENGSPLLQLELPGLGKLLDIIPVKATSRKHFIILLTPKYFRVLPIPIQETTIPLDSNLVNLRQNETFHSLQLFANQENFLTTSTSQKILRLWDTRGKLLDMIFLEHHCLNLRITESSIYAIDKEGTLLKWEMLTRKELINRFLDSKIPFTNLLTSEANLILPKSQLKNPINANNSN